MMWPFKHRPSEPEGIPWGEFVKTRLVPILGPGREMSWEEATMIDGASYNEAWEMGRKQGLREAAAEVERLTAALGLEQRRLKVSEEALRRALEPKP